MYCWSCGHANADNHKFCGECGKSLLKPEQTVHNISSARNLREPAPRGKERVEELAKPASLPQDSSPPATVTGPPANLSRATVREGPTPRPANPLIEEPRAVHESLVVPPVVVSAAPPVVTTSAPTPIRDRVPNRIPGPSFLGLSDDPSGSRSDDGGYLLEEESESSPWRGYLMLALLVVVGLLVIRNWSSLRLAAADYSQRLGVSESPKNGASPARVASSGDAAQTTPDAAPVESNPADKKPVEPGKPEQSAKLEKPQNDNTAGDAASAEIDNSTPTPAISTRTATKDKPAVPAYDNSQLVEAQKYLQGRGVQQDCNRGLELLRSAAQQPNPKARIQMAALYDSGHCVTQDFKQAYNWFLRAQELEPHNKLIERNLDSLWARMSVQERRSVLR